MGFPLKIHQWKERKRGTRGGGSQARETNKKCCNFKSVLK